MNAHKFPAASKVPCAAIPVPGEARAPVTKMPCRECNGAGEAEYMSLTEDRYRWRDCHVCDGTGLVAPYCEVCESNLTVDGFCCSCDEYPVSDRIPPLPEGWARVAL